jgi:ubiquitin-activating enzyme E1
MTSLDESLYSRQLYVMGHSAVQKLTESKVLISGLGGIGVEVAKCIILSGINNVTLHDMSLTTEYDLTSQYYLSEKDLNKSRLACSEKLGELNPYVKITKSNDKLTTLIEKNYYDVIILTDNKLDEQIDINNIARKRNIKFISCNAYGGFGNIFCDFGENFVVIDTDGEEIKSGIIMEIKMKDKNYIVKTAENHNLSLHDTIVIMEKNKEYVSDIKIVKIINRTEIEIKLSNSILKSGNISDLTFLQIKNPKKINFKSLSESIKTPEFCSYNNDMLLHTLFQEINRSTDSKKIYTKIMEQLPDSDKNFINKLIEVKNGCIPPLLYLIGSITAQEIMKACTGKFNPIYQWFYYDIYDVLKITDNEIPKYVQTKNNRYIGQEIIFGTKYQKMLNDTNIFIVGSGAIGCEHLKNFAMMGIGNITITDMDNIEKSNLNRQFLFRNKDIGKPKSLVAATVIKQINPNINITHQQNRVDTNTEHIYNEEFFSKLTCVTNALDNVQARLYVDSLCVNNEKPLLESGTLGTKGNVQVIVPHLTESYGSSQDPPEKSIPVCTLKNFPYQMDHCVQYMRDLFEGWFNQAPNNLKKYQEIIKRDPNEILLLTPGEAGLVRQDIETMIRYIPSTYEDCVKHAYDKWHELFRDQIVQLKKLHPKDSVNADGIPFWSGTKKYPSELTFDINNDLHIKFIESFSNIWANIFNINEKMLIRDILLKCKPREIVPDKIHKTIIDENKKLLNLLKSINKEILVKPVEFEKDDDTNFHIDLIAAGSNLRALNYDIRQEDRHKIKGIAGKIIPAISTTTSLVSSLVSLELYKIIAKVDKIECYKNSYVNLAVPFIGYSEPAEAKKTKPLNFTLWDSLKLKNGQTLTIRNILEIFNKKYNVEVTTIMDGQMMLYSDLLPIKKQQERLNKTLVEIYKDLKIVPKSPIILSLISDESDLPICKIYL